MIRRWMPFVLVALVVAACTPAAPTPSITGVAVTPETASLFVGETEQLSASLTGVVGVISDTSIAWTSDDESVATVDVDGLVTAVAPGTAAVTATSNFDDTKFGTATITVSLMPVDPAVTDVEIETPTSSDLGVTATTTVDLDATVTAVGGASTALTWMSDDDAVATVDASGLVTSVAAGTVTITATSDFDATVSDSIVLTVHDGPTAPAYADILGDAGTAVDATPLPAAAGGFGTVTYALEATAELPEGLTLDPATGAIAGTSYAIDAAADVVVVVTDELGQEALSDPFDVDLALVFEYLYTEVPAPFPNTFTFDDPAAGTVVVGGIYVYLNGVPAYVESSPGVFDIPNPLLPFTFSFQITDASPGLLTDWAENDLQGTLSRATDLTVDTYDDGPWTLTVTVTADGDGEQANGIAIVDYVGPAVLP